MKKHVVNLAERETAEIDGTAEEAADLAAVQADRQGRRAVKVAAEQRGRETREARQAALEALLLREAGKAAAPAELKAYAALVEAH